MDDLLRERGCRPYFPLEFVKYGRYSPHSTEKSGSAPRPLATVPILGQPPGALLGRKPVLFVLLAILVLLQGCGFRLRGTIDVPEQMDPTNIQAPRGDPLARNLTEALRSAGVEVVDDPKQASAVLRLLKQDQSRRVRAVDGRGKVVDYELTYKATFDVLGPEGQELAPRQSITLVRTQVNPGVEVLGKQEEQEMFVADMQRELSGRILRRLKKQLR